MQVEKLKDRSRQLSDLAYLARLCSGTPHERAIKFLLLGVKLDCLALPERPHLGDPGLNTLSAGDLIGWLSFLPYYWPHLFYFTKMILVPALPKAARRAVAKFTFGLNARQALG